MTRENAKKKVLNYIKNENWGGLMVRGEWGIGKTYFVKETLESAKIKYIYIPSFGCSTVEQIIGLIYAETNKVFKKCAGVVGGVADVVSAACTAFLPVYGAAVAGVATTVKKSTESVKKSGKRKILSKNIVLVFDDIERYSGDTNQLFGFLNSILEFSTKKTKSKNNSKKFKIIAICNTEKCKSRIYDLVFKVFSSVMNFDRVIESEGISKIINSEFIYCVTGENLKEFQNCDQMTDSIKNAIISADKINKNIRTTIHFLLSVKSIIELYGKNNFGKRIMDITFVYCLKCFNPASEEIEFVNGDKLYGYLPKIVFQCEIEEYVRHFLDKDKDENGEKEIIESLVDANTFVKDDDQYFLLEFLENGTDNESDFAKNMAILSRDEVIKKYKKQWSWVFGRVFVLFIKSLISEAELDKVCESWTAQVKDYNLMLLSSEFNTIHYDVPEFQNPSNENIKKIEDKMNKIKNILLSNHKKNINDHVKDLLLDNETDRNETLQEIARWINEKINNLSSKVLIDKKNNNSQFDDKNHVYKKINNYKEEDSITNIDNSFNVCIKNYAVGKYTEETKKIFNTLSKKIDLEIPAEKDFLHSQQKRKIFMLNKTIKILMQKWTTAC